MKLGEVDPIFYEDADWLVRSIAGIRSARQRLRDLKKCHLWHHQKCPEHIANSTQKNEGPAGAFGVTIRTKMQFQEGRVGRTVPLPNYLLALENSAVGPSYDAVLTGTEARCPKALGRF